ncbi:hypothetical protein QFZ31_005877 [Neobacillus niacini]|uniref:NACHT domain-containing protein n=1 Tax=Neobacillus driksii TaxID=3035913 RepID=UPI0027899EC8|nr:NACHT domain-containing protein [Neobacillus niacini]MDQ0975999.1 hypothetical protein [Neobacillus niacini]
MNANLEIVKNVAPIVTPFISSVVDVWIKPKLQEMYKKSKLTNDLYENIFEDKFKDYLKRGYERNNIMNTVVFQNRPKNLAELYIPLSLQSSHANEEVLIDRYKAEFISKYKKLVITDSAGMGKSTLLKWMFIDSIKSNEGVPIFIELRKLSKTNKVLDEIFKELNPIDGEFDRNFILNLIKRGDFIFFLDGYDEIPLDDRSSVTEDLQSFISKASENIFILSSRPQTAIASFADFHEFNIKPLEQDEAFNLLRKYDEKNNIAEQLIEIITEGKNYQNLEEFLTNPLMVSLLFKGYEYKQTISYKKSIFYRQVYDALFENHDLTKGGMFVHEKLSGLDIEEFHTVLRYVAYFTWKKGKVEYDRDEIIKYLSNAKGHTKIPFKESKFLTDLVANVPLFYKDGNLYRWKHKSLQEYFSAQYICTDTKELQETILNNIYSSNNFADYLNVLDLCYDIDYKTFRRSIIYKFICDALEYNSNSYQYFDAVNTDSLLERKKLTFGKKFFIVYHDNNETSGDVDYLQNVFMSIYADSMQYIEENFHEQIKGYKSSGGQKGSDWNNFIVITFEKPNYKILELLWNKKEKYIENSKKYGISEEEMDIFNKIITPTTCIKGQIIDDNSYSWFNHPKNFEVVNHFLLDCIGISYSIRFDILRELKKEIEREKESLISDDLTSF